MPSNPFSLPGRPDPHEALDPSYANSAQVLKYYLDVDNTGTAFLQFMRTFPGPLELTRRGQLVVAMGMDGCGKSALINRCAWGAERRIEAAQHQCVVVDARGQARVTDEMSVRIKQVATYVLDFLRRRGMLTIEDGDLERLRDQPADMYSRLHLYLDTRVVVFVRLPGSERVEEIFEYAQRGHAQLVFFAELHGLHSAERVRSELERTDLRLPIVLQLGRLSQGNGARFVHARFRRNNHANEGPELDPELIERMLSERDGSISIRELQRFLYLMYERIRREPDTPPKITWEYILKAYYKMADELQRNVR